MVLAEAFRDLAGALFANRYQLVGKLAGGGMGEVYRGHDLLLDRAVAIKVLQPSLAEDQELVARFKAEARAAARLTHPNAVAVYDWGCEGDATYYMVMEYVPGTDLRDVLVSKEIVEPAQAVEIVAAVCDALAAAHSRGLVHRDVKPENVLIDRDGRVKVADFGIAILAGADPFASGPQMGTLRYLAPEQARGKEASASSDVWAAGALLSELLTGRPPLQGSGPDLLKRRAEELPTAPSHLDPRIPADLDAIVLRACALEPSDRFADASDMAAALRRVAARSLADAPPVAALLEEVTGEIHLPDLEPTSFGARRRRGAGSWLRRRVALVAAAAVLVGAAVGAAELFGAGEVSVPKLVGASLATARERAAETGVSLDIAGRESSFTIPAGQVISQRPLRGDVPEGATVRVVVSSGLPLMEVPTVVGMDLGPARVRLRVRGLEVAGISQTYAPAPAGTVLEQSVSKGRLRWGSSLDLVVSKGPQPVAVPDVTGATLQGAKRTLGDAGFQVEVEEVYSDDIPAGRVVATSPSGGEQAPEGSVVRIAVSVGPRYKSLRMPDVRNMSVDAARARLEALGLRVRIVEACDGGTTVVDTDPIAGTTVRENDLVALFLC